MARVRFWVISGHLRCNRPCRLYPPKAETPRWIVAARVFLLLTGSTNCGSDSPARARPFCTARNSVAICLNVSQSRIVSVSFCLDVSHSKKI